MPSPGYWRSRLDWPGRGVVRRVGRRAGRHVHVAPEGAGGRLFIEHDGLTGIPAAFGLPSP
jgi:hypothetical protein